MKFAPLLLCLVLTYASTVKPPAEFLSQILVKMNRYKKLCF